MMRWLAKLNLRKRPLSGNEPVELSYFLSGTGVLRCVLKLSILRTFQFVGHSGRAAYRSICA
jgi:hypothetical protein